MAEEFTNVGSRLVLRMKELGLKQLSICQKTGLSTTAVSNYCTGKRLPDTLSLYKLANVLKVSMEWILTGEDVTSEDFESIENPKLKKEKQSLICDGSPLEDEEADLIAMYRLLPSHVREDMFDQLHCLYLKYAERKKESIYWTYAADKEERKGIAASDDGSQGGIA